MRIHRGIERARRKLRDTFFSTAFDALAQSERFRRIAFRRLFTRHLDPSVLAEVSRGGLRFCVDPKDRIIAFHLLSGRDWQREELDRAIAALRTTGAIADGKIFVDVGANIGTQTVYAMQTGLFSGAVAIEAEPSNVNLLRRNVSANGLSDQVKTLHAAASRNKGVARLLLNRKNFGAHSIHPGFVRAPRAAIEVPCDTLEGLLAEARVSLAEVGLVWLDVEGHELEVLRGMGSLLDLGVPIALELSLKLHGGSDLSELKALLAPHYRSALILRNKPESSKSADRVVHLEELALSDQQNDILVFNSVDQRRRTPAGGV
jgi:FkbM family methyltransferase